MGIIEAIGAALEILKMLLPVFIKSDAQKLTDIKGALLSYIQDIDAGLQRAKETKGDTSELEKVLNKHRN